MEEALDLARKAEALIAEGDAEVGMPLLFRALDLDPICFEALENLGIVAVEERELVPAVLDRLDTAVMKAALPADRKRAAWLRLTHAAFFGELAIVRAIANEPGALTDGDAAMQAAIGALLVELGERDRGIALLDE